MNGRRVAFVHDWLPVYGGAEHVLEQMLNVLPEADLFSLVDFIPPDQRAFLKNKPVTTSFIQRMPFARKKYRHYIFVAPLAIEQFDLSAYDLVITSSYAVAKGVITSPDQLHICMCHSPPRYAWDLQHQYLQETHLNKGLRGLIAKTLLHYIRMWDVRTANGVDVFLANSNFIARRIWKTYRREATVLYPPVDVERFTPREQRDEFYMTASRMTPYKRMDLIVEAFTKLGMPLVVFGDGPERAKIEKLAGPTVRIMGWQPGDVLKDHMERCKAFVFAAVEDFGIVPVEAQAAGAPVIGFGKGGLRETIVEGETGLFFAQQTPESLMETVRAFESGGTRFDIARIRRNAERFDAERFRREFSAVVEREWSKFAAARPAGVRGGS
ncbi:MAG: glycosyltransferase family 4 protein [Verrucomicrobia bacterium]|nr:glycosyltransferase family 4 protein [Verrucomicrobiota bacterium]